MADIKLGNTNNEYKHSVYYFLLLTIIACIAWWPVSFYIFSLKNDALNYFLPVRRLVSESYYNGMLPAWTPYLNLGYPLHGDMQSGVWNPFVQLFSLFGPYTLLTLHLETLLYVILSGIGMFCLLKNFKTHPYANIIVSTGYMLCGFNTDSAQFLNWIAGASFLPFVFLSYYKCLTEKKTYWAICSAISLYFYFSCAYPADFIILIYLLAALFILYILSEKQKIKSLIKDKDFWITHATLIFLFIFLSSPAIVSYYENLPLTERGSGALYDDAMSNPLHPALLSSYFYPPSTWKMPGVNITDPLERNSFFGIFCFLFFLAAFFTQSYSLLTPFYKLAFLIFLLFSFGEIGGVRIASYYLLPLMDSFRHPANAKLFTIFFSCLLAAELLHAYLNNKIEIKKIGLSFYIISGLMFIIAITSLFIDDGLHLSLHFSFEGNGQRVSEMIKNKIEAATYTDIVWLCFLLQFLFLLVGWQMIKHRKVKALTAISIANSILFCMIMQPFTVVKTKFASEIQELININTKTGYPIPDLQSTLAENSTDNEKYFAEIGCINLYNKKIGRSNYRITPSNLLLQNEFWFNDSVRSFVMNKSFLYNKSKRKAVFTFTKFNPLTIEGKISTTLDDTIVLSQTYHPRWKLFVDNNEIEIKKENIAFMSFSLPGGIHTFYFKYHTNDLIVLWIVSIVFLGLLIVSMILFRKRLIN